MEEKGKTLYWMNGKNLPNNAQTNVVLNGKMNKYLIGIKYIDVKMRCYMWEEFSLFLHTFYTIFVNTMILSFSFFFSNNDVLNACHVGV